MPWIVRVATLLVVCVACGSSETQNSATSAGTEEPSTDVESAESDAELTSGFRDASTRDADENEDETRTDQSTENDDDGRIGTDAMPPGEAMPPSDTEHDAPTGGAGGAASEPVGPDSGMTSGGGNSGAPPGSGTGGVDAGGPATSGAIPACEGFGGIAMGQNACRTSADCVEPDQACSSDYTGPSACGAGCAASRTCDSDADCGDNASCVEYVNECCVQLGQPEEVDRRCVQHCTDSSCGPEEECGEDGLCTVRDCNPGDCDTNRECNADTRRCEWKACSSDSDCDCGFCAGRCYNGPGTCMFTTGG